MRMLFSYMGGSGHLGPLTPLARAAIDAGHQVLFIAQPFTAPQVERARFDFVRAPDTSKEPERLAMWERAGAIDTIAEREDFLIQEGFAGIHARWHADTVERVCNDWRPDVIVRDEADFAGAVIGEKLGVPCVTVLVIGPGSLFRHHLIAEPLNQLRAAHGLPADPGLEMLTRGLVLSPFPPSFRDPGYPLPPTGVSLRPFGIEPEPDDRLPDWVSEIPDRPNVYFSLGTEFNTERKDIFAPVIEGVREMPVNLIVTVGRNIDPADFGEQPANVHIESYIPQALLMPQVDLVITHGGSGTVMGTLSHGLPMVVIPLGADQPQTAARIDSLGAGRVVLETDVTPATIQATAREVMDNPEYRAGSSRLQAEIDTLPGPGTAIPLIEALVGDGSSSKH